MALTVRPFTQEGPMPSKSKRAASRQATIRQKRRKGTAAPQVFDVGPTKRRLSDDEDEQTDGPASGAAPSARAAPAAIARPTRASRRADAAAGVAPTYPYLGSEIKRILIISGLMFAILVVLTFFLGD